MREETWERGSEILPDRFCCCFLGCGAIPRVGIKKSINNCPEPSSKFNKVKCHECESEQIVYSHSSTQVICNSCGNVLSKATGSIAQINGKVLEAAE